MRVLLNDIEWFLGIKSFQGALLPIVPTVYEGGPFMNDTPQWSDAWAREEMRTLDEPPLSQSEELAHWMGIHHALSNGQAGEFSEFWKGDLERLRRDKRIAAFRVNSGSVVAETKRVVVPIEEKDAVNDVYLATWGLVMRCVLVDGKIGADFNVHATESGHVKDGGRPLYVQNYHSGFCFGASNGGNSQFGELLKHACIAEAICFALDHLWHVNPADRIHLTENFTIIHSRKICRPKVNEIGDVHEQ